MENKYCFEMEYTPRAFELVSLPLPLLGTLQKKEEVHKSSVDAVSSTADAAIEAILAMVAAVYLNLNAQLGETPSAEYANTLWKE